MTDPHHIDTTAPSTAMLIWNSVNAGVCAGVMEVLFFWWQRDYPIAPSGIVGHLAWLVLLAVLLGVVAAGLRSEGMVARAWLVLPGFVALTPLLTRRFGLWAFVLGILLLAWWVTRVSSRRASPVAAGLAGGAIGAQLGHFFLWHYAGRSTAAEPLVQLGLVATLAFAAYLGVTRFLRLAVLRTHLASAGFLAGSVAIAVGIAMASGDRLPDPAPASSGAQSHPPVVVIVLDTVRADHLSVYGYHRDTMPALAAFATSEAVIIDRAISNGTDSLSGHASIFTGLFPNNHGAHRPLLSDTSPPAFGYSLREDVPTLAELLRARGYETLGVTANYGPLSIESGLGLGRGFDLYRSYPDGDCELGASSPWAPLARWVRSLGVTWLSPCLVPYRRADVITDEAIALIDAMGEDAFFLFVNYFDAHSPYLPPGDFQSQFPGADPRFGSDALTSPQVGSLFTDAIELPDALVTHFNALYDGELRFLDTHLSRLLERLQRHPAWGEMLVIVTSDHGEALGEHSYVGHSSHLYDEIVRVPLFIRPGLGDPVGTMPPTGQRWDQAMQLVDLAPFILRHAGAERPRFLDGQLPEEAGQPLRVWSYPSPLHLTMSSRFARELRSIESDRWKLIEDSRGGIELYDLRADPREVANVAALHPERVARFRAELGPPISYRSETSLQEDPSEENLERLRSLGYVR